MPEEPALTLAQRRALEAVGRGQVLHRYHDRGNVYEGPLGIGSASLVKLELLGLIQDFRHPGDSKYGMKLGVMLTAKGRAILETPRA